MASLLELDRETIDAISLTRFGWAIGKHVAQVTAALLAEHLGADHAVTGIPRFLHHTFQWPAYQSSASHNRASNLVSD